MAATPTPEPPQPVKVVDYRFSLANERTFLAYTRTGLALQVAGLGALQFLTAAEGVVRQVTGVSLVLLGGLTGVAGYLRRHAVEEAMARDDRLPVSPLAPVLLAAALLTPVVAAVLLVL